MAKKCFVIMPFGEKKDPDGKIIDFDDIYEFMIRGAIEDDLKMECVRCDKIPGAGVIHRDMIQQIFDADVAVVDITTTNANVFYELGVRHALRKNVTVIIRREGTNLPFNIRDLRVINYDPSKVMSMVACKKTIRTFVEAGLHNPAPDSLVHQYLNVEVKTPFEAPVDTTTRLFGIEGLPSKAVGLIPGDLKDVTIVDIWVNSENTNLQMARFYDRSISGLIRYMGAKKDDLGNVTEDLIADDLERKKKAGNRDNVDPGTVVATTSGELSGSHGVKRIFHAATVQGAVGTGYVPVANLDACVRNALSLADKQEPENEKCSSILFPLFGTGTGRGDLEENFLKLLGATVKYLRSRPQCRIDRVYFLAYSESERRQCMSVLERTGGLKAV